jgi:putative ABC transport system permease protein
MDRVWHDIKVSIRQLIKNPVFTLVAVVAIALGIGATTAIFSIVNSVLLRPLPYKDADSLMTISEKRQQSPNPIRTALPTLKDWQSQTQAFESVGAYAVNIYILTGIDEPRQIVGSPVSADFFKVMGVEPQLGRVFNTEQKGELYVVLSDSLWRGLFHADPGVVGKTMTLSNKNYVITGVMPRSFEFPGAESVMWTSLDPPQIAETRSFRFLRVVGRLKPGATLGQAQSDMNLIASRLEQQYPDSNAGVGVRVVPLHEQIVGKVRPALYALLGAVGFVLLIAIANVANLLLARALVRERDFAVLQALGASRLRLVQRMITESLVLALIGGALGLVLAIVGVRLLVQTNLDLIPRLSEVGVDFRVLLFTLLITVLSGIIFGIAPILQTKVNLNDVLKDSGRTAVGSSRGQRLRSVLVVAEVALSLVLLITASLMIRSFVGMLKIDPGFRPDNLLTLQVILPQSRYSTDPEIINYYKQVLERVRAVPGVQAAGAGSGLPPIFNQSRSAFIIEGYQPSGPNETLSANFVPITNDYFKALGTPLLQGRAFNDFDRPESESVVIIDEHIAKRYFPDGKVLGRRISFNDEEPFWRTVVGVVGNLKFSGNLYSEGEDAIYLPDRQWPYSGMFFLVRTNTDPASKANDVRNAIWSIDRDLPIAKVRTMTEVLAESVAQPRLYMTLLSVFAAIALILASIGLYGVVSYSVAQRGHEIGLRMALGAQRSNILRLILVQGLKLVLIGIAIGIFCAWVGTRVLAGLLYGVTPTDLLTFVAVPLFLIGVALLACIIPAHRATQVDPIVSLREG